MERLRKEACDGGGWSSEAKLELLRVTYHLQRGLAEGSFQPVTVEELRQLASEIGEVEVALVDLTLARNGSSDDDALDGLRAAVDVFERYRFISGAIEALLVLADSAVARGLTTRASGLFARVADSARSGGHLQALMLSILGSFHCALASADAERAASARKRSEEHTSELQSH